MLTHFAVGWQVAELYSHSFTSEIKTQISLMQNCDFSKTIHENNFLSSFQSAPQSNKNNSACMTNKIKTKLSRWWEFYLKYFILAFGIEISMPDKNTPHQSKYLTAVWLFFFFHKIGVFKDLKLTYTQISSTSGGTVA